MVHKIFRLQHLGRLVNRARLYMIGVRTDPSDSNNMDSDKLKAEFNELYHNLKASEQIRLSALVKTYIDTSQHPIQKARQSVGGDKKWQR